MSVVFALVGGVASGKSTVARAFEKLGATVIDADAEGHEVLKDAQVRHEIRQAFGDVFAADGSVDRAKLGAAVFGDAAKLERLNGITHPRIRARTQAKLDAAIRGDAKAVVLDISLLLESKAYEGKYDVLLYVACPEDERERRAEAKRGWPRGEVQKRQQHQLSLDTKRALADAVIDNGGSEEATQHQVQRLWNEYVG
ncbi:MAG: dephospho-CoA kinase [Planctomycetes bacterium]|jgi:dephospho-CoA kinase|nr:dephospho-CoA kinase [Planctomycetota bacterium]MCL4730228.1 dephospho-CoA kinase [Planctomycetota bacterium]